MNRFEAILLLLAAICVAILIYIWSALPAQAAECKTLGSFKSSVLDKIPGAFMTPIDKKAVAGFIKGFNAIPPVSNFKADEVEIVTVPDDPNKVAVFFNHGCGVVFQRLSPQTFDALMGTDS